jgi:hypothetical protein
MSIINIDSVVNLDVDALTDNVKVLEYKILNINRGILALEYDVINEIKNKPRLKQMYLLRDNYEKDLRELKRG